MQHHETRIYRVALDVARGVRRVVEALPPGYGYVSDQVNRASLSIVLNFSEGCGKRTRADRARFFAIALGSSNELRGAIDVVLALGLVPERTIGNLCDECDHVGNMLRKFS